MPTRRPRQRVKTPSALVPAVAGFGVILLLLLSVAAIGVTHIHRLSDQLTAIVSERNQKATFATGMHGLHQARHQSLLLAANLEDPFARDEELMRFAQMAGAFIQVRDQFLALPLDGEELNLWQNTRDDLRQVEEITGEIIDLLRRDALQAARDRIHTVLHPRQESMIRGWQALLDMQRAKNEAALRLEWNGHSHQVGASIGVVHVPPHWASLDECLAAADAACYKAKQSGRNAIVVHANGE